MAWRSSARGPGSAAGPELSRVSERRACSRRARPRGRPGRRRSGRAGGSPPSPRLAPRCRRRVRPGRRRPGRPGPAVWYWPRMVDRDHPAARGRELAEDRDEVFLAAGVAGHEQRGAQLAGAGAGIASSTANAPRARRTVARRVPSGSSSEVGVDTSRRPAGRSQVYLDDDLTGGAPGDLAAAAGAAAARGAGRGVAARSRRPSASSRVVAAAVGPACRRRPGPAPATGRAGAAGAATGCGRSRRGPLPPPRPGPARRRAARAGACRWRPAGWTGR